MKANAAHGVAGSMENRAFLLAEGDGRALFCEDVGRDDFGGFDAEPAGLDIHHFEQRQVGLVHDDRGAG